MLCIFCHQKTIYAPKKVPTTLRKMVMVLAVLLAVILDFSLKLHVIWELEVITVLYTRFICIKKTIFGHQNIFL